MKSPDSVPGERSIRGFTLVEVLVYLALYALMFSGALSAVYAVIESSARDATSAALEEEGDYLIAKLDAATRNARAVTSDLGTSTSLSAIESDGTTVSFTKCGTGLCQRVGSLSPERLNGLDTSVSNPVFVVTADSEVSVAAAFTIAATTSDGHALSRDFYMLDYLHL